MQLVIPAFNEEARLPLTLEALRAHVLAATDSVGTLEVIVVDNASTDATAEVALRASTTALPVRVVSCERRGKGAAVRAGMAETVSDLVGFMDADCATDLAALAHAARFIAAGADIAIASRAVPGSVTTERHSRVRTIGASLYRRCTQTVAPGLADTQCGFKVFRGELGRAIFADVRSTGFSFDVEVLGLAQRRGAQIVEFPAYWTDVPGSTFLPAWHGAATFLELARIHRRLKKRPVVVEVTLPTPEPTALTLLPAAEA